MSYASIDDLRAQLGGGKAPADQAAYDAKMKHPIPPFRIVDRVAFILKHCEGKRVLEFGASGPLTEQIRKVAADYRGVDRAHAHVAGCVLEHGIYRCVTGCVYGFDLDAIIDEDDALPPYGWYQLPEVIICGEVLEHLGNPQWFLTRLKRQYPGVGVIVTVPNAFAAIGHSWIAKGIENVNADHVAWYSPKTLSVLLERAGYGVGELFFYNGKDATAEGLIVVTE